MDNGEKVEREIPVSEAQYEIIKHPVTLNEVVVVKAGPGSGKTFTLMAKIAYLIGCGQVNPDEVLVLSMANRSVKALRLSLSKLVGEDAAGKVSISTFHSFCASLVDEYPPSNGGIPINRRLMDLISWRNMATFFLSKSVKLNGQKIDGTVSAAKLDRLLSEVANKSKTILQAAAEARINPKYLEEVFGYMSKLNMLLYSDLVHHALDILNGTSIPSVSKYKVVVVDEYQDVYPTLQHLVESLVAHPTNGCPPGIGKHLIIAGDPDQSIYGFLGASANSIDNIPYEFPGMNLHMFHLAESFRCSQQILDAAMHVLGPSRPSLYSRRKENELPKPVLIETITPEDEQLQVANEIVRLICCLGGLIHPQDIAVLTRTNAELEQMLSLLQNRCGIQTQKISHGNLWVRSKAHIFRDLLSILSGESDSNFSLLHALIQMDPNTGRSLRAIKVFNKCLQSIDLSGSTLEDFLYEDLKKDRNFVSLTYAKYPDQVKKIADFINTIQKERQTLLDRIALYGPVEMMKYIQTMLSLPGLDDYFYKTPEPLPLPDILTSFNESLHSCYENYLKNLDEEPISFIDYFLRNYDNEVAKTTKNLVNLSTIHSAKGLEFPIVFVLGQSRMSALWDKFILDPDSAPDSVARLLYVALTRARDILYIGTRDVIAELSEPQKQIFTNELPGLSKDSSQDRIVQPMLPKIMDDLHHDLQRPWPAWKKVERGAHLFSTYRQSRLVHTSSALYRGKEINRIMNQAGKAAKLFKKR